ncbi:hypothetical protein [Nonomuraea sp. SYSU D8015]|uniref:hypothetical protein n=1 Tax=Nonomuraea sp. SYSU D8015 TaxID=2593644 RepID=UPI001660128C|nr:hypothetical protein [Nonomuraea sp. SYSU D8015]
MSPDTAQATFRVRVPPPAVVPPVRVPSPVVVPAHRTTILPRRTVGRSPQPGRDTGSRTLNRVPDTAIASVPVAEVISQRPVHDSRNDPVLSEPSHTDAGGSGRSAFLATLVIPDRAGS